MMAPKGRVSEWWVERLVHGDLSERQATWVREELEAQDGLGRVEDLESSNVELLRRYPPAAAAEEIRRRSGAPPSGAPRWLWLPALASAALLALLATLPTLRPEPGLESRDEPRLKGAGPRLSIVLKAGDATLPLPENSAVEAEALVQLSYVASGALFGAVLSYDGRGVVTRHRPVDGGQAPTPRRGRASRPPRVRAGRRARLRALLLHHRGRAVRARTDPRRREPGCPITRRPDRPAPAGPTLQQFSLALRKASR